VKEPAEKAKRLGVGMQAHAIWVYPWDIIFSTSIAAIAVRQNTINRSLSFHIQPLDITYLDLSVLELLPRFLNSRVGGQTVPIHVAADHSEHEWPLHCQRTVPPKKSKGFSSIEPTSECRRFLDHLHLFYPISNMIGNKKKPEGSPGIARI
jgi:hypothetical protein